jgi:hypothetical protein
LIMHMNATKMLHVPYKGAGLVLAAHVPG